MGLVSAVAIGYGQPSLASKAVSSEMLTDPGHVIAAETIRTDLTTNIIAGPSLGPGQDRNS
jgi:hypothetical protein